jgi:hypothetical protein
VIPSFFSIGGRNTNFSANGSSAIAQCFRSGTLVRCDETTSNVLFDGNIPTLNDLEGDMWARELLTVRRMSFQSILFYFTDIPNYRGIGRIEVVLFNCPEWGIGTQDIEVTFASAHGLLSPEDIMIGVEVNPTVTSCDSLVRVCIPQRVFSFDLIILTFNSQIRSTPDWVYIAEVIFYGAGSSSICPPDIIITPTPDPQTSDVGIPQSTLSGEHLGVHACRSVICDALAHTNSSTVRALILAQDYLHLYFGPYTSCFRGGLETTHVHIVIVHGTPWVPALFTKGVC